MNALSIRNPHARLPHNGYLADVTLPLAEPVGVMPAVVRSAKL
ncbi:MAG: hypothetical protein JWQ21_583 [Herminiimonas sp.]|nr:hypothetical protein [Herminiimonas sp.]